MSVDKRVCIISIFPPIIGGVSTHTKQLSNRLSKYYQIDRINLSGVGSEKNTIDVKQSPLKLLFTLLNLRLSKKVKIFHFHTSRASLPFIVCCIPLKLTGANVILSIHTGRPFVPWLISNSVKRSFILFFYSFAKRIVFMNYKEAESLKEIAPKLASKITSASPFVSPSEFIPLKKYQKDDTFRILVMGLWYPQYNYSSIINLLIKLAEEYPKLKISLSLVVSSANELIEYKSEIVRQINKPNPIGINLYENVTNIYEQLYHHDLFIRPSLSDSYGLCVAEALYVGTPAIASNVCTRAIGATLYEIGDDMKVKSLIIDEYRKWENQIEFKKESLLDPSEDSFNKILAIYNELSNPNSSK